MAWRAPKGEASLAKMTLPFLMILNLVNDESPLPLQLRLHQQLQPRGTRGPALL